jgi:sigma-B regulation protein RsbU (phosphoserine phosphatase)
MSGKPTGPIAEQPPAPVTSGEFQPASVHADERLSNAVSAKAAHMLVEHLFTPGTQKIAGVEYAVEYKLAEGRAGGDIVDVYQFDNESVAFSVADISGKGVEAAVQAAMVKYGLRGYASIGLVPESVLRALDRLYLENSAYENRESFATVFFAHVTKQRDFMTYASAAHDSVFLVNPEEPPKQLEPTAPLLGVFDDQHHLFQQRFAPLRKGSLLVAVTDGVTEARTRDIEFYGMRRLADVITKHRSASMLSLARTIISDALHFADGRAHDDMAVLTVRFV